MVVGWDGKERFDSLDEMRAYLTRPDYSPLAVIEAHLARVRERIALEQQIAARLDAIATALRHAEEVSPEELVQVIEMMNMVEQFYTAEQLVWLRQRQEELGEERIRAVEVEWPQLVAAVRAAMDGGTNLTDPGVRAMATRWRELTEAFHGNNPSIKESGSRAFAAMIPDKDLVGGIDKEMVAYIAAAECG